MSGSEGIEESLSGVKIDMNEKLELEWPGNRVRSSFIDFFVQKHGHVFWPSSPTVPVNDPTLLFANAGMNQYKSLFLGVCDPSVPMYNLTRATNSQKCIRAGGKHNDLDDVGKDVYHHTFFEMLGSWSFGDYFKKEAITWAWECLTVDFGLDKERLYATYFGGDEASGLPPDEESKGYWLEYLPADRVLPFGLKDNFWEMGAVGPCGPCSEIHYDRIGNRDAANRVNADVPDVIEIWNLVFMEFNREADGSLKKLPNQHVDTGMGLERLTSILQGKDSNYDTDLFVPIFEEIQRVSKNPSPYTALVGDADVGLKDMAYRVVADHIRTLIFAIADGAVPSSEGRGYVLRRILRRAVRYGQEILGAPAGFFTQLVPCVIENYSGFFTELLVRKDHVMSVIADEETSFCRTLDQGVKHFKKVVASLSASGGSVVSAKDTHILFSSMGFPVDLTELMAAESGYTVDVAGFETLMEEDRKTSEMAEAARKGGGGKDLTMAAEQTAWLQSNGVPQTESDAKYIWFENPTCSVVGLFTGRSSDSNGLVTAFEASRDATCIDNIVGVILDKTSFYYESGGQIYDTGVLKVNDHDILLHVTNTQSYGGYVVHIGTVAPGAFIRVGDKVSCHVDYERRGLIAPNHTMTHVLNYAIRQVLVGVTADGTSGAAQCDQKGSLVDADKLRFDFSWGSALTISQLTQIEKKVQDIISKSLPVFAQKVPLSDAFEINSLRAIFGEQYPDPVRVISVGNDVGDLLADPNNSAWAGNSIEFCGGTHLTNTSQAVDFVLVEESGIAKGVRRITGMTKKGATEARTAATLLLNRLDDMLKMEGCKELLVASKAIKVEIDRAVISVVARDVMKQKQQAISDILKKWTKLRESTRLAESMVVAEKLASCATDEFIVANVDFGADGKIAKKIQEKIKGINENLSIFLLSVDDAGEKVGLFALTSQAHRSKYGISAVEWNEAVITAVGKGKGGGKPDLANANIQVDSTTGHNVADVVQKVLDTANGYVNSRKT